ncbi:nucleotide exchange factor GrpE [Candidatus Persebacteraceae bacterium Df01]|jgi:molecular chaperone GrpE|uniref:Protein GrpE n=1 Tax=Candidatus Doriopsillibacter californiensis TaxID=2970740 RepID=A0ABT7QJU5_9GAMM|nr:nucleotide exchange factor GrpE [Candidatus Persebacteraceae bacterium Df01]
MPKNKDKTKDNLEAAEDAVPAEDVDTADTASLEDGQTATNSEPDKPKSDAEELAELRDLYLRSVAETENQRRRAEEKIANARKFAISVFATSICDVCDCLESASTAKEDGMREGLELTLRKLTAAMDTNGIRPIRPDEGASFDPNLHQSVGFSQNSDLPPQTVATVVQTGYTLNGRVVRAATILLNKPPEDTGDKS